MREVMRDMAAERRLQCLLESFGAIEIDQSGDLIAPLDSPADYIVLPEGNVHSWCSFSVHAVDQLRKAGCVVTIENDFPYQVVDDDPPWFAGVEPDPEKLDWFGLRLGIIVEHERVDVLPALLDLLDKHPEGKTLDSLLGVSSMRVALPVGTRRYVTLPPQRLRALLQVLLELYRGERLVEGRLRFIGAQANSLVRLQQTLKRSSAELVFEGVRNVVQRGRQLAQDFGHELATPTLAGLETTLRPYQREGLQWLQNCAPLMRGECSPMTWV